MTCYFIDFENVMSAGMKGIEEISPSDRVIVLYSQMAHLLDIDCVRKILAKPHDIEFVEVQNGTLNALDFRLVVLVTDSICKDEADEYVVISNDKGFEAAVCGWKELYGVDVKRCPCILAHLHPDQSFVCIAHDEPKKSEDDLLSVDNKKNNEDIVFSTESFRTTKAQTKSSPKAEKAIKLPPLTEEIIKKDVPRLCGFTLSKGHPEIVLKAWQTAKSNKKLFISELQAKNGIRTGMAKKKAEKMGPAYEEWLNKYS